jgi:hypothetical protein
VLKQISFHAERASDVRVEEVRVQIGSLLDVADEFREVVDFLDGAVVKELYRE